MSIDSILQIITVAFKTCIRSYAKLDIQIAGRATVYARGSMPGYLNSLPVFNTCRYGYADVFTINGKGLFMSFKNIAEV